MDTEEHIEIQEKTMKGHALQARSDYDYEARKESYKGGVRGKLGGLFIGALIGAIVGAAVALVLPLVTLGAIPLALGGFFTTMAGFSAAGMVFGAHEFGDAGKMGGAAAAVGEKLSEQIGEIKRDIGGLKATITGKPVAIIEEKDGNADSYDQYTDKPVFWNVAALGLVVGAAAGALLVAGGLAAPILHHLAGAAMAGMEAPLLTTGCQYAASMTAMGLFGASYGVNRDIFWNILDKTDNWLLKGLLPGRNAALEPEQSIEKLKGKTELSPVVTVVYPETGECRSSDSHHRDRYNAAKQALLNLDPSKTIRQ